MRLYTYFRSSAAFRVRIALNLKGQPYESSAISLPKGAHRKDDFGAINAQRLVPALADDGHLLTQSLAIMEYLEEKQPVPPLLPKDLLGRARVRSLAQLIACEIHPLNNLRVLQHLKRGLGQDEAGINAWYRHWVADGLAKFEADLTQTAGTGTFCHGETPGMADCCLVPQIFNAKRYECDLAPYPVTMRVFEACMKLDAFDRAQPMKQPDAE
ncbi:MAG: maleylacetoacetate isomerase [Proteobacteria bacterium]|nr:maleylacetoacetate isomerase [Pseudomonadota bacterium]